MAIEIMVPLMLDGIEFDNYRLENPEHMGDLGGAQSIQQHDFPGGIRTQKSYGYFPAPIKWRAKFSGGLASERVEEVKRVLSAGEVILSWGERSWAGLLARFSPTARHTWLFDYELEFWPRIDLSSGLGETNGEPSPESVMDLQLLALSSWLTPGAITLYPFVALSLTDPINALLSAVDEGLALAQGVVSLISNLQQLVIQAAANVVMLATAPLQVLLDPLISSPAWDIFSRAMVINNLIRTVQAPRWVIPSINPNLMALSAQYYGDATLWRTIANANGLFDPQPVGSFQILIPPPQQ